MIGKKRLSEVRRELEALLEGLPANAESWLDREIESAAGQAGRDAETLEMLKTALQRTADKKKRVLSGRKT